MDIYATIARQVRFRRLEAGLTQEELAAAAGISTSFLAYLEARKKKPSLATVAKLAMSLGTAVSGLFDEGTIPRLAAGKQKALGRLLKLMRGQTPENAEIILAVAAALSRKLLRR